MFYKANGFEIAQEVSCPVAEVQAMMDSECPSLGEPAGGLLIAIAAMPMFAISALRGRVRNR